jgi:hypothetical protein
MMGRRCTSRRCDLTRKLAGDLFKEEYAVEAFSAKVLTKYLSQGSAVAPVMQEGRRDTHVMPMLRGASLPPEIDHGVWLPGHGVPDVRENAAPMISCLIWVSVFAGLLVWADTAARAKAAAKKKATDLPT